NESINEPVNESINEPVNESINEPVNETINESINETINETINESSGDAYNEAPSAKDLAVAILLNKTVWLDIDDRSEGGRNSDGELVAILYLSGLDGRPVISPSFNRMLVDYNIAELNDSIDNEFDPADWWPAMENESSEDVSGADDSGTEGTGLNVDINPAKPNVDVNIGRLNIDVNPAKPNVNVSLSGLKIDVNPTSPTIDVDPSKSAIDVDSSGSDETKTGAEDAVSYYDVTTAAEEASALPPANGSEPLILENSSAPITLINPAGVITVINSTGQVTLIDPALPVKVVNTSDASPSTNVTEA
ncbi:MAG TPA: hypothetical protein PLQ49_03955, partial [Methanothrix sp.]|nr:hypothetical protein [Methanothrix sp.]